MGYKAIEFFTDLQDNNHAYEVGDVFPRVGLTVTAERIAELSGSGNLQKKPLIAIVAEAAKEEKVEKPKRKAAKK